MPGRADGTAASGAGWLLDDGRLGRRYGLMKRCLDRVGRAWGASAVGAFGAGAAAGRSGVLGTGRSTVLVKTGLCLAFSALGWFGTAMA
ncbi:MAG: hypothetical protein ACR2RE_27795, partial [Geminicoccaceae bacterium]